MSTLEVAVAPHPGAVRVALVGELDISTAPQVEQALVEVEAGDPAHVVLDLAALEFLDSTGLRVIVAADARARSAGRRLTLVQGPEMVRRIFRVTRLDERLDLVEDAGALLEAS